MISSKRKTVERVVIVLVIISTMVVWINARVDRFIDVINGTTRSGNSVFGLSVPFPLVDEKTKFYQLIYDAGMIEPASFRLIYRKPFLPWGIFSSSTMQYKAKLAEVAFVKYVSGVQGGYITLDRDHINTLRDLAREEKYREMEEFVDELSQQGLDSIS